MSEQESRHYIEILAFNTNLEHIGDIIDKNLMELAQKRLKKGVRFLARGAGRAAQFSRPGRRQHAARAECVCHARRDAGPPLAAGKDQCARARSSMRRTAISPACAMAGRRASRRRRIHLDIIRDLKRINSHLTSVAYPILERSGELTASRLRATQAGTTATDSRAATAKPSCASRVDGCRPRQTATVSLTTLCSTPGQSRLSVAFVASERCPVMRVRWNGFAPLRPRLLHTRLARHVRLCAFGLVGAGVSGCATQSAPNYAGVHQPAPQRVAERQWKVEIEEDGKPAQLPPVRRMRPEEDDPSQPWSPNYGKPPGEWQKPVPAKERAAWPQPIEASVNTASMNSAPSKPSRSLNAAEADQVILRAIQNHEVRRP